MSNNGVHRKLKDAFSAVIDGNKARAAAAISAKPLAKNNKITAARLSVHGTGSVASSPALSLHISRPSGNELFCFNLNPYMDRYPAIRNRVLSGIFFTRLSWENQGVGSLNLLNSPILKSPSFPHVIPCHGPRGLGDYLKSVHHFLLSPVLLKRFYSRTNIIEDELSYSHDGLVIDKISLHDVDANPTNSLWACCKQTSSYICRIEEFQPHADEEKIENLINSFQLDTKTSKEDALFVRQLQRGMDAQIPSTGQWISAKDILKEPHRTSFAIVDCPTESHFLQLRENPCLKRFHSNSIKLIAHLTPQNIFSSSAYQQWCHDFSDCKHLVLNNQNYIQYTQDEFKQIYCYSHVHSDLFPPVFDEFVPNDREASDNIIKGCIGLSYKMNMSGLEMLDDSGTGQASELDGVKCATSKLLAEHKDVIGKVQEQINVTNKKAQGYFPRLVVLGSGGTHNHKFRAHPGFLLMIDEKESVLLDCGELALERIYKVFGKESEDVLDSIKMIFISHIHIDHHCGFLTLLDGISRARRSRGELHEARKTFCILPQQMCMAYKPFVEHLSDQMILCPLQNRGRPLDQKTKDVIGNSLGLKFITPFPVSHSVLTYGITLDTACGKRVVYSSDTLPMSKGLLRSGKNADLLIHDCLYVSEDNEIEANYRKHSTLGGALKTALAVNARFTLLTHFSPYLPVQAIPDISCDNAAMAYDFLSIALEDLPILPQLGPAIGDIFPKSESDMKKRQDTLSKRIDIIKDLARMM